MFFAKIGAISPYFLGKNPRFFDYFGQDNLFGRDYFGHMIDLL